VKLSAPQIKARKRRNGAAPLVMVTAYDEPGARLAAAAGVDIVVGG
jgi:ketopantoate hydroxymethyltransferase